MTETNQNIQAELVLSPEGHVFLDESLHTKETLPIQIVDEIRSLFEKGYAYGLLHLGIQNFSCPLPPSFLFWQNFSRKFVSQVCKQSEPPAPSQENLQEIINQAFLITGIEYLNTTVLSNIWETISECLKTELRNSTEDVQSYLKKYNDRWNFVGRVCFHLAENKKDEERPFAFMATYITHLSQQAVAQHVPLQKALLEYSGDKNQAGLLALLLPVQKASEQSSFIKHLVETGSIFQVQKWSASEAHSFLKEIPLMESSGVMVRVPNWWNAQKPPRPKVVVKIGEGQSSSVGLSALMDFDMHLALDNGEKLTRNEWNALLKAPDNLIKVKGAWVEIDRKKLETVLSHWDNMQKHSQNGLTMAESMRLLAGSGASILTDDDPSDVESLIEWSTVVAGDWLKSVLDQLRNPQHTENGSLEQVLGVHLKATLRPYQYAGVQWLWLLYQLKLGGCLADDMGLGKTIQLLSLMLHIKHTSTAKSTPKKPHLLVVPASLLGNWQAEAHRFTPSLKLLVAHNSVNSYDQIKTIDEDTDLVITTYGNVYRIPFIKDTDWDIVVLDEAQLIKNPGTKQTRAVKELKSSMRITLTGTPVENRLGDLWSLFDFSSPGLLGSRKTFSEYSKKASKEIGSSNYSHFVATLRGLTQPYILRRLKSDKNIISDLPDKTEVQSYCSLSKEQIQLYQQAILELAKQVKGAEGIRRQGIVLGYITRFKQICNHPDQWLGYGNFSKESSGKFLRLQEICEEIAAKQEKVLIFTQFTEIIPHIAALLTQVFGREGLILNGDTPIKKRPELVESFQQEQGPPFFVLSLKAGGTGLNLTRASHVIHFDRWWNPAVENQATDRAYRIGQKHPVLVHKFICTGTIEEKIDSLIASKKNLSNDMLEGSSEVKLTELSDDELMDIISLDIKKAMAEF
jgi:hypothetical protein